MRSGPRRIPMLAPALAAAIAAPGCVRDGFYGPSGEWIEKPGFTVEHREFPEPLGQAVAFAGAFAGFCLTPFMDGPISAERYAGSRP